MHFVIKAPEKLKLNLSKRAPGSPKALFEIPLQKAAAAMDADGTMSPKGLEVVGKYAKRWVQKNERDLEAERMYPELGGYFYDLRSDPQLAREMAG